MPKSFARAHRKYLYSWSFMLTVKVLKLCQGFSLSTPIRSHWTAMDFFPSRTGHPECSVHPVSILLVSLSR